MNGQEKRILAGVLVGMAIPTAIYIILHKTAVVHFAYVSLLIAVLFSGASLWQISKGGRKEYLTNLAFPLVLKSYLSASIAMAVVFVALDLAGVWTNSVSCYMALYVIVLALTAWKLLAIGAAQEKIHEVGDNVKAQTSGWKMLQADVDSLLLNTPEALRKDITAVRDAIRYADPRGIPEVASIDSAIAKDIAELKALAASGKVAEAQTVCERLQTSVKDRANRLKTLK